MSQPGVSVRRGYTSRARWLFVGFLAIAVFLLASKHRTAVEVLPWLVLARR